MPYRVKHTVIDLGPNPDDPNAVNPGAGDILADDRLTKEQFERLVSVGAVEWVSGEQPPVEAAPVQMTFPMDVPVSEADEEPGFDPADVPTKKRK